MRKLSLIIFILWAVISYGQAPPQGINYQAVAYDFNRTATPGVDMNLIPAANRDITVRFSIIALNPGGTIVYREYHQTTTDIGGLFNLIIGKGILDSSPNSFEDIDWGAGDHFLKVEIDNRGAFNYVEMSTQQLWSVPYALYAKKAANGIDNIIDNGDGTLTINFLDSTSYTTTVLNGLQGPQGVQGPQGIQGPIGQTGPQGPAGANGTSISNSFVQNDSLFLVLSNGQTVGVGGVVGPQGIQGPQGVQGPIGQTGPQGPAGANGTSISNSFVQNDSLFLVLSNGQTIGVGSVVGPQGIQGPQGATGPQGPIGPIGPQGITNPIAANITALDTARWNAAGNDWKLNGNAGTNPTTNFIGTIDNQDLIIRTNNTEKIIIKTDGNVGIGTNTPQNSSKLDVSSTTQGFLAPRMTITQRNLISNPSNGLIIFNLTSGCLNYFFDGIWFEVCGVNLGSLYTQNSIFCSSGPTVVNDVTNPITGKTWMDRNLGASRVANTIADSLAFGDFYQWGRRSDGHQCRNSPITNLVSSIDQPSHGDFIIATTSPTDWRNPQNNNLWQGLNGINNPCPFGYRIPTEVEFDAERNVWSSNDRNGAFNSILKLTSSGDRDNNTGVINNIGFHGIYWTSNINLLRSRAIFYDPSSAGVFSYARAHGFSVRCIKN